MAETPKSERRFYPNLKGKVHDDVDRAIRILYDNLYELQTSTNKSVSDLKEQINAPKK